MLVLVLDTSTPAVQAALVRVEAAGVRVVARRSPVDARGHGELLAGAVAQVLAEAGATPADLAAIVAGTGPGPFTGLRVGLVTAAAMGQALTVPTYGVCSLDGIGAATRGHTLVATDARRREIYWAMYQSGVRGAGPEVGRPAEIAALARAAGVDQAAGDGALRYQTELALPVRDEPRYPLPQMLACLALERIQGRAPSETLQPRYLRRPDAAEPGRPKPVLPGVG